MDFQSIFNNFLAVLITGILGALAAFLIKLAAKGFDWLSAKIESVKSETAQQKLQSALKVLQNNVTTTVTMLQQTVADEIRESIENNDGRYTREDLLKLKDTALKIILEQTEGAIFEILGTSYSDIEGLVNNMIETEVFNLKLLK